MGRIKKISSVFIVPLIILLIGLFTVNARAISNINLYPQLYRSADVAAQGGVGYASFTGIESLFYNPAGIAYYGQNEGWDVNIPIITLGLSSKVIDFTNDFQDKVLSDSVTDKEKAVFDLLEEYMGDTFSGEGSLLIGVGKRFGSVGLGLAFFARGMMAGCVHEGFGTAGILDVKSYDFAGATLGVGTNFLKNTIHFGVDAKILYGVVVDHAFTASELVTHADDFDTYLSDEIMKKGVGFTGDIGIVVTPFKDNFFNPSIGISLNNIGDLKIDSEKVIPQTLNVGVAIRPKILEGKNYFQNTFLEVDFRDITKNYEEDNDWGKRFYLGGGTDLFKFSHFTLTLRGGFYQGYPSFGVEAHFLGIDLEAATYAVELGKYAGETENRRYLVKLGIRW